jgi:hypothetical protein
MDNKPDDENTNQTPKPDDDAPEPQSELSALRNRTLEALLPIVDNVEEAPERKFEILMTVVRSSNDPALLNKALNTAQQIHDTNSKANALLEVLNEINYHLKN